MSHVYCTITGKICQQDKGGCYIISNLVLSPVNPQFKTHPHKITSVDLCHKLPSLHNPSVPTPCLNHKNKSHPVKSAQARTLGVSVPKLVTVGMHFRIESENAPSLFGRVARNLSRKKGFSGCFPLVSFLCRSKGKYTKSLLNQRKVPPKKHKNQIKKNHFKKP